MFLKKLAILAVLLSCTDEKYMEIREFQHCPDANADKITSFIIDCANAANPMSDEEGEDLVSQCAYRARQLYCSGQPYIFYVSGHRIKRSLPCSVAVTADEIKLCASVGYIGN